MFPALLYLESRQKYITYLKKKKKQLILTTRETAQNVCLTDNGLALSCLYVENPFPHLTNSCSK